MFPIFVNPPRFFLEDPATILDMADLYHKLSAGTNVNISHMALIKRMHENRIDSTEFMVFIYLAIIDSGIWSI